MAGGNEVPLVYISSNEEEVDSDSSDGEENSEEQEENHESDQVLVEDSDELTSGELTESEGSGDEFFSRFTRAMAKDLMEKILKK